MKEKGVSRLIQESGCQALKEGRSLPKWVVPAFFGLTPPTILVPYS